MRKILATSVALESITNPAITGLISLEEEQVLLGEANDLSNNVNNDLTSADRLIDVSDTLEDLAVIADGIDKASPAEVDLINAVGSMAVTGTEIPSEEIVPVMESFKGKKISTESFSGKAKTIWENIQKFLKKIMDSITLFFKKIFVTFPNLKKRIAELKDKIKAIPTDSKNEEPSITVTSGVGYLYSDGDYLVKHEDNLLRQVNKIIEFNDFTLKYLPTVTLDLGNTIENALHSFNPIVAKQSATEFANIYYKKIKDINNDKKYRNMLGRGYLHFLDLNNYDHDISVVPVLESLSNCSKTHFYFDSDPSGKGEAVKILPLSLDGCLALLASFEKIISSAENFNKIDNVKLQTFAKKIQTASERATKKFTDSEDSEDSEDSKVAEPYYRAMVNFNKSYLRLVSSPATDVIKYDLAIIKTLMIVIEKSLVGYQNNQSTAT